MKKFSQIIQKECNRFKQRLVPIYHGVLNKIKVMFGNPIVINDASNEALAGLKVFGKSTQDGTPSPDAPVEIVSVENTTISVLGKNLIPYPYFNTANTTSGITFTDNGDGSITANGTATDNATYFCAWTPNLIPIKAGKYSISGCPLGGGSTTYEFVVGWRKNLNDTRLFYYEQGSGLTVELSEDGYIDVTCVVRTGVTVNGVTFRPQIETGESITEYTSYKPEQSLSLSNTLRGIPVTSGGNYTDANGQQWICDEVDFERGMYVQRVGELTSYNNESISTPYMSMTGDLTVGATVLYQLPTPIETPLTAEQIEAYKSLHTNEPNTTIYNDQNAWMEVMYITQ